MLQQAAAMEGIPGRARVVALVSWKISRKLYRVEGGKVLAWLRKSIFSSAYSMNSCY
jgi:hypothetical protein